MERTCFVPVADFLGVWLRSLDRNASAFCICLPKSLPVMIMANIKVRDVS